MLWSAVTCHRFFGGRLVGQHRRVQRTLLNKGSVSGKLDGDKSPAESGDKSPHSKRTSDTKTVCYLAVAFSCVIGWAHAAEESPNKNTVAIEALSRLKGMDLETNPALKGAVLRVLERTRGTPQFVELVRDFKLKDQGPALLDYAIAHPSESSGVDAIRLLSENEQTDLLKTALSTTNAPDLLEVIANSGEKKFIPFIEPLVTNLTAQSALRKKAVHALASTQDGSAELLRLAREDKLGSDVKLAAVSELNNVRWPAIKEEAARVLPLPKAQNSEALPPIAQLVKMPGDPAKGAQVFRGRRLVALIAIRSTAKESTSVRTSQKSEPSWAKTPFSKLSWIRAPEYRSVSKLGKSNLKTVTKLSVLLRAKAPTSLQLKPKMASSQNTKRATSPNRNR